MWGTPIKVENRRGEWGKITGRPLVFLVIMILISLGLLPGSPFRSALAQMGYGYSDLYIAKTASVEDQIGSGQQFDYEITVVNAGPDEATGVTVSDVLPSQVAFISDTCSASTGYDGGAHTWTWQIGTMAASVTEQCMIRVRVLPSAAGEIINSVSVIGSNTDDTPDNNQAQASDLFAFAVEIPTADFRGLIVFVSALALAAIVALRRSAGQ